MVVCGRVCLRVCMSGLKEPDECLAGDVRLQYCITYELILWSLSPALLQDDMFTDGEEDTLPSIVPSVVVVLVVVVIVVVVVIFVVVAG